jgi:uncharacterized protein YndB with AHSA1/START domain
MSQTPGAAADADGTGELLLTRTINVDRRVAWRLWTESRHLAAWWGPHGFTNPVCSIDPTPGGRVHILMRAPGGEEYLNIGVVRVADEPQLLVFSIGLMNADGSVRLENLTTVELEDRGAATKVTVRVQVLHATPDAHDNLSGMRSGWSESLDRLADLNLDAEGAAQ